MPTAAEIAAEQIAAGRAAESAASDSGNGALQKGSGDETPESLRADRDKWRSISRKHEEMWKASGKSPDDLKALLAAERRLREAEEADKSELQKAVDRATAAERLAADTEAKATRYEVAAELGIQAKHLKYLAGSTREEIEESAKGILADFPETYAGHDASGKPTRPKERLRSGAGPVDEPSPNQVINDRIRQAAGRTT